jgi:regulatory protein
MDNPYYERLVNTAIRFISFRPRSQKELTDFLAQKMAKWKVVGAPLLEKVVARMGELGYVDDGKFASWWITQRTAFRPKGKRALVSELRGKGIAPDVIEEAFASSSSEDFDEYESAKKIVTKKLNAWGSLPNLELKKKVYAFLAARGFSSQITSRIIDELVPKRVQS